MIINTDNLDEIKINGSVSLEKVVVKKDSSLELKEGSLNIMCTLSGELKLNDEIINTSEMVLSDGKVSFKNISKNITEVLVISLMASGISIEEREIYTLSRCEKEMISGILLETEKHGKFSEEMICLLLTTLLLKAKRGDIKKADAKKETDIFLGIVSYMENNIGKKISLDDISYYAGISKTSVKKLFKEEVGFGACEYFTRLKIERAKELIADNKNNFTEIAEILGYDSIHYFSRQFKQYVSMSPTEYLLNIKKSDIV